MSTFKHPTTEVELEGIYIVKNLSLNMYIYLSDNMHFDNVVLESHEEIVKHLVDYQYNLEDSDFNFIGNNKYEAFLDA